MRVLLIYPTVDFEVLGSNPLALEQSRGFSPPLGLLFIASYLQAHADHDITVVDANAEQLSGARLRERVARADPEVVGITAMTHTLIDVIRTVEAVKSARPAARVVLGGPHTHLFPEESIRIPGVDFLVRGEGEATFEKLLDRLEDRSALEKVPGLVFRDGDSFVDTGLPDPIADLDTIPFPARALTDIHRYSSVLLPRSPATTMFTSRGCPFKCSFCDRPHLGKRFRARSAANVVDEMESCIGMGIREFLIYDDTFTVQRKRVYEICREISRRGLELGFDIRARVDTVDRDLLRALAAAGCRGIHYGVEAGTEKILKVLRKDISLHQTEQIFKQTRAAGIQVLAYFMIGAPTENRYDIRETFRIMRKLDPDYVHLTILTPFPGTEIYEQMLRTGLVASDVWRQFAAHPTPDFVPPHWPGNFSLEELNDLLIEGYRRFYRRPGYAIRRLARVRSLDELVAKTRAGLKIVTMRSKSGRRGRT